MVPVIAWHVERAGSGRGWIIPVMDDDDDEIEPGEVYALQHPDGSFRFPDGERCDSEGALLESLLRRRAGG